MARQFRVRVFITAMNAAACLIMAFALYHPANSNPVKFACYLAIALLAASFKVGLPGIEATLSVNFLFTLLGILELSLSQTLLIGAGCTLVQCCWKPAHKLKPVQVVFNASQVMVSSAVAYATYYLVSTRVLHGPGPLALLAAAITHFACNTGAMSAIIGLTENKPVAKVWNDSYLWSFPYYLVGAAVAGLVSLLNRQIGWQASLLVLPPIYLLYRSYRLYLGKLEDEKRHAERVSNLHLRTIEALALAIGAKDNTTGKHLQRVRVYAMEVGRELGLSDDEKEALRAASVLHDIGKLAVPEQIISKPGKLTPYEFEKMKIHPVVGAEILQQVEFPYPVVPIVLAHHEKWDGSGYPYGLKGEEIPLGARILAAVDCLDALATDRQYRKALPLQAAMAKVVAEAGASFDPRVVEVLERRYVELETMARQAPLSVIPKLSTDIKIVRGAAPATGFAEAGAADVPQAAQNATIAIAHAHREESSFFDLCGSLGAALGMEDVGALLSVRVKRLVPYESMAVYMLKQGVLLPEWVGGEHLQLFSALKIPLGEGLCGWVARNREPILNGNPAVEPGFVTSPGSCALASALAVPVESSTGVCAVVALYRTPQGVFSKTDLIVVETLVSRLGLTIDSLSAKSEAAAAGQ
jgi:putative nucleotidyltransferase with HDIG domain